MTTKAQHTKGPWRLGKFGLDMQVHAGNGLICDLGPDSIEEVGEAKANARLIAAAPDLLEALLGACNELELILPLTQGGDTSLTDKGAAEIRRNVLIYRAAIDRATT
jgi:hypothetical protein